MKTYKELQIENDNLTQQVAWLKNGLKPEAEQEPWHVLLNELERWRQEVTVWMQDGDKSRLSKLKRQRKELKRLNRQLNHMRAQLDVRNTWDQSLMRKVAGPMPELKFPNRPLIPNGPAVFGPCHGVITDAVNRAAYERGYNQEQPKKVSPFIRLRRFMRLD